MKFSPAHLAFVTLLGLGVPETASAQIEEIVVTARQRAEKLRDVPATVTVLDEQTIARARIDSLSEVAARTPGFVISDPFGRLNPSPSVRGLVQAGIGDEPNVGLFVDGTYVGGRSSINGLLFDLERIEVVKGPQSALYGRNTFGGAINVLQKQPTDQLDGYVEGTVGTHSRYELKGAIGGPIVDGKLSARIAAVWHDFGGFYRNETGGTLGDQTTRAVTLALRFTPSDALEILARSTYSLDRDQQPPLYPLQPNCSATVPSGPFKLYCGEVPARRGPFAVNNYPYGFLRETARQTLQATLSLGDVALRSLSSFAQDQSNFVRDDDYTPVLDFTRQQSTTRKDLQQDLRLQSADDGPLTWLAGANYYRFQNDIRQRDINNFLGLPPAGPRSITTTTAVATYGSATWRVRPDISLTGELRFSDERKSFVSEILDRTGRPLDLEARWTSWTPKFAATWDVTRDATLYASVARGFKTGGFNDMTNLFDSERAYQPETNWTYEVGAKTSWLDRRLQADLSLFWIDWSNQQVSASSAAGQSLNFYNTNAGATTSKGFELALRAKPTERWSIDVGYAFTDARFDTYSDPDLANAAGFAPTGSVADHLLPRYSRHQVAASTEYRAPIEGFGRDLDGYIRLEGTWQSKQYAEASNTAYVGDDTKLNARVGLVSGPLELSLWVKNLTDDVTPPVVIRFNTRQQGTATRAFLVEAADGRTYGATFRWHFGP
jgi:iron complex outermembrane receptor protein